MASQDTNTEVYLSLHARCPIGKLAKIRGLSPRELEFALEGSIAMLLLDLFDETITIDELSTKHLPLLSNPQESL